MRYAHEDQVTSMIASLRSALVGLLDKPEIPEATYDAVMDALVAAPERYITWSSEEDIANEYWDAVNHD